MKSRQFSLQPSIYCELAQDLSSDDEAGLCSCHNKAGRNSCYDEAGRIGILLRILPPGTLKNPATSWHISSLKCF